MSRLFRKLKLGLLDSILHKWDKLDLRSELVDLPVCPAPYTAAEIQRIRKKLKYSQGVFARVMNVSVKTVQSWEAGDRTPSHAALRLLEIIDKGIYQPNICKRNIYYELTRTPLCSDTSTKQKP